MPKKSPEKAKLPYESNPFLLAVNALGRFFNSNVGWAITLIIFGVVGFVLQVGGEIASNFADSSRSETVVSTSSPTEAGTVIAIIVLIVTGVIIFSVIMSAVAAFISGM